MSWQDTAKIQRKRISGMKNGGWAYDAYPEIETLDAGKTITVAQIEGPAVITCIHITRHFVYFQPDSGYTEDEYKALGARGIIIEIYFDGSDIPSVKAPLGDFFADGCGGRTAYYSTPFIEKAPEAYNCFIPMPFKKSARVELINETDKNLHSYIFVEFEKLERLPEGMGYFHASWKRSAFQLDSGTCRDFFRIDGCGHLVGRSWSICTTEPYFEDFFFIMEGNNEIRLDGEAAPSIDYLGTEDSFGFSWGFRDTFCGLYNGMNYIKKGTPSMLSIYRFLGGNAIRFNKSLDLKINWSKEFVCWKKKNYDDFLKRINEANQNGGAYVDYTATYYWYQDTPGYGHEPMPPISERLKPVLDSRK